MVETASHFVSFFAISNLRTEEGQPPLNEGCKVDESQLLETTPEDDRRPEDTRTHFPDTQAQGDEPSPSHAYFVMRQRVEYSA
jgi:hypothetical protein